MHAKASVKTDEAVNELKGVIDRILAERAELAERLSKLKAFLNVTFDRQGVTSRQRSLLAEQLVAMDWYREVLDKRLLDLGVTGR
jgi:predicted nuclease with TOPRIM domain